VLARQAQSSNFLTALSWIVPGTLLCSWGPLALTQKIMPRIRLCCSPNFDLNQTSAKAVNDDGAELAVTADRLEKRSLVRRAHAAGGWHPKLQMTGLETL
jgi:hypothetical protein